MAERTEYEYGGGQMLMLAREMAGDTKKDAAKHIKVAPSTYNDYETDQSEIGVHHLVSLCNRWGLPPARMFRVKSRPATDTPEQPAPQESTGVAG